MKGIRVGRSALDGYGVFATRWFEPGDVIADVEGIVYELGTAPAEGDRYCLLISGLLVDMVDQTRWINHSCDPNAIVERASVRNERAARFVAARRITPGEEITFHYAFAEEVKEPCRCGAANCSGWIVDSPSRVTGAAR